MCCWWWLVAWWASIPPRNDREWQRDVARPATASFDGDVVTIENVRDFRYRSATDFDERWTSRTIDLDDVVGLDLYFAYWGSPWIAHTIMSWQLRDAPPLAISIETRKEEGEAYSAVLGFFRQFELYYVVADERDVVRLRTNNRGEDVYLYPMKLDVDVARRLLLDYVAQINELSREPAWYNAATHNCTTTIRRHVQHVAPRNPWDWRILVNGYIDELGYERGQLSTELPFAELRERSRIDEVARASDDTVEFSTAIRARLPGYPRRAAE